jgi:hypothetical protein
VSTIVAVGTASALVLRFRPEWRVSQGLRSGLGYADSLGEHEHLDGALIGAEVVAKEGAGGTVDGVGSGQTVVLLHAKSGALLDDTDEPAEEQSSAAI